MIAQVSYGLRRMCEIPEGVMMGHSTIWPLDSPRD
jgi:hypothetical protein